MRSRKSKRPTPWFSDTIQKKIEEKNCAKHVFEHTGNLEDRCVFRRLKNDLKHTIRQAKLDFLQSTLLKVSVLHGKLHICVLCQ